MDNNSAATQRRPVWFVGAAFGGHDDQTTRFLRDGGPRTSGLTGPGCRSAVLHVCMCAIEQFACAIDRRLLNQVDVSPAGMIASAGVSFQRFVRHRVTERVEHGAADDVLGGDELDLLPLALPFAGQRLNDPRVSLSDAFVDVTGALGVSGSCRSGGSG